MRLLEGKVALITGAGSGIGRDMAAVFVDHGARLVLAGRTPARLEDTAASLGSAVVCVEADVRLGIDHDRIVETALNAFGRLDCAVNNAAIDGPQAPLLDYPESDFDAIFATNVKGIWLGMRRQIAAMMQGGGGAIVNISSAVTEPTVPNMSAYVASKYAVEGLSKAAAREYAALGVRVNILQPGTIDTPMVRQVYAAHPEVKALVEAQIAAGRLGTGREIGEAAAWLCSDRARYATGAALLVDGGFALT